MYVTHNVHKQIKVSPSFQAFYYKVCKFREITIKPTKLFMVLLRHFLIKPDFKVIVVCLIQKVRSHVSHNDIIWLLINSSSTGTPNKFTLKGVKQILFRIILNFGCLFY